MTDDRVADYYNAYWADSDLFPQKTVQERSFKQIAIDYAHSLMGDVRNKHILEIGPGQGLETLYFLKQGARVCVVDISGTSLRLSRALAEAHGLGGSLEIREGDALKVRLADSEFDIIYANQVLMHLDYMGFIRRCRHLLKDGGKAIFVEPLRYNPCMVLYRSLLSPYKNLKPRYVTLSDLYVGATEYSRFRHQEFYLFSLVLWFYKGKRLLPWLRRLHRLESLLIDTVPLLRNLCWFTVVEYTK